MTMHKALHPHVNKLLVSIKEGERGFASIKDSYDASIQRLEVNIEKFLEGLFTATKNDTDNTKANKWQ